MSGLHNRHTAGPWAVCRYSGDRIVAKGQAPGSNVAYTTNYVGKEQQEANAKLIAAAPELLTALNRLVIVADLLGADRDEGGALWQARVAIMKADGP